MLHEPLFYLLCVPAVLLYGISKGGFGGSVAVLAVPLMALIMSPTQAAAILLPLLIVMDVVVLKTYWGCYERRALQLMLPGAMVGIAIGYFTAGSMNDDHMRILVGALALVFGVQSLMGWMSRASAQHNGFAATAFSTLAGFTSFSIHAGAPPFQMYLVPKNLKPLIYAGTSGIFFASVNAVKLVPYYSLGQFSSENLIYSLMLAPLAPIGVMIGHYLVKRTDPKTYYGIISIFLIVVGAKLLWEGLGL